MDNIFRFIVVFLGIHLATLANAGDPAAAEAAANKLNGIAGALFILPYMFTATFAGAIADKFSKSRVALWTKILEIAVMTGGLATLAAGMLWPSMVVLMFTGMQSALFSPAKYGILPELIEEPKLGWANGVLQGATFLAIIIGTVAGPWLFGTFLDALWIPGLLLVALAVSGTWAGMQMHVTPAARPDLVLEINPVPEVRRNLGEIHRHPGLSMAVAGMFIWWLVAVLMQSAAPIIATSTLGLDYQQAGLAMLPIALGMGFGCFLASKASGGEIELGLVPIGAFGMFVFGVATYWLGVQPIPDPWLVAGSMGVVGFFAGFFSVPLQSYIVNTSDADARGGIWAAQNFVTAFGMVTGSLMLSLIGKLGFPTPTAFLSGGILMLFAGAFVWVKLPEIPLRFQIKFLFNLFYRVRVRGLENVPKTGGALLVANHQSFLDGIIVAATVGRPVRFLMSDYYYKKWFVYPFAKVTNTIPISSAMSPREIIHSLRAASEAVKAGDLVCIYAEGQITRHGHMLPVRRGYEKIMRGTGAPIIPVAIDGMWESNWGMRLGGLFKSPYLRFRKRPINVAFGAPLADDVPAYELRQAIQELLVDAFDERRADALPLHREALRLCRKSPLAPFVADVNAPEYLSRAKYVAAAIVLARKLKPTWDGEEFVGIVLPPSAGSAALNLGALLAGHTPVNLNYTMSPELIARVARKAGIRKIYTSRIFLEKLAERIDLRPFLKPTGEGDFAGIETIFLEDIRKSVTSGDRVRALLAGLFKDPDELESELGRTSKARLHDVATLIFSSGSTGDPKGVMLTHWNIWSNCVGALQVFPVRERDTLLGILPMFHSFGFMATLWLPLLGGVKVAYYPNPLDARAVGGMVEKYKVTILIATPTFLQAYTRRVEPAQFGSLKFVLTGAEKLRKPLADEFLARFGIRPIEGYGATETSPVTSLSTVNIRQPGIFQVGNREGWIGHPLPGVAVRVVDPATMQPLPVGEPGMIIVRGPNIMAGYYKEPEKTADVLRDGWYITGDVGRVDEDGFIQITDRLSRFSKIGGEMVPHLKVEDALQELSGQSERVFAVTGVPDERKGERLVVLYACDRETAAAAAEGLAASGLLPNLWIPKFADFFAVKEIPILGTGKTDLQALNRVAREFALKATASAR
ncbi:MAG: MFS transporter [Candidatus Sumerlaeia bacterium]|nr:MFS transporter [Candidatus Sumerlaeia bacterium]